MEQRKYKKRPGKIENGRSTVFVECPFCQTEVEAFIWSLAGSGKKCPKCGAVHKWNSGLSTRKDASQQSVQRTFRRHWDSAGKRVLKEKVVVPTVSR